MLPTIPADVAPALYFGCVGLAVLVTGVSKSGFGGAIGILAIPLMAMVMPAQHMLGIMLPVLIAADILSNLHHLGYWHWRYLRPMMLGAVVGVAAGSVVLAWLALNKKGRDPESVNRILSVLIGLICLVFVGVQLYGLTGRKVPTLPPGSASSLGIGVTAGVVSTLSHSAGPIVTLYLLQEKLQKRMLVGSLLLFFLLVNTVKVPTYIYLGYINTSTLHDSIWFLPLLPAGTLLGAWMHKHLRPTPFLVIMYTATAATAGHMVWKAVG